MSAENNKTLQYINEYYDNQKKESETAPQEIFEMIEQMMAINDVVFGESEKIVDAGTLEVLSEGEEKKFNVQKFMSTALTAYQVPSSQAGKAGTEERKKFQFHIASQIGKKGGNLAEKIEAINLFVDGSTISADASIAKILSHCGTLSILAQMVEDFNASAAGFAFEAFLAALLQGVQIDDPVGGSLPIEDAVLYMDSPSTGQGGTPVSLKLLNSDTTIEGSIENLLTFLGETEAKNAEGFPYIEYIVAIKHSDKHLGFNSFVISTDNFFQWIQRGYFDWTKVGRPRKQNEAKKQEQEENSEADLSKLKAEVEKWKKRVSTYYFPFWGFEDSTRPEDTRLQYYIPSPPTAKKSIEVKLSVLEAVIKKEKAFVAKRADKLWADLPEEYYISLEERNYFKEILKLSKLEKLKKREIDFITTLLEKLKGRRDHFITKIKRYGRGTELSPVPLNLLHTALHGGEKLKGAEGDIEKNGERYLKILLKKGEYNKWAEALKKALKKNQFHISNASVTQGKRSDTTHYGTLKIDKKMVEKILKTYSEKLLVLCAPIYESLGALTDNINRFFLGKEGKRKAGAAISAAKNANELSIHAKKLKDTEQEG